jgi:DNA-binding NarL/FixJ family response regulator
MDENGGRCAPSGHNGGATFLVEFRRFHLDFLRMDAAIHKRVLIVDDHALFRAGLALIVVGNSAVKEVLEAGSVSGALEHVGKPVNLILLDHHMPGLSGLDGIALLRNNYPDAMVAMVSGSATPPEVELARTAGADGYIPKTTPVSEIQAALSALLRGQLWFPHALNHGDADTDTDAGAGEPRVFTVKQLEVLAHLSEGLSNRAISKAMGVTENTVRSHVSAVLHHLHASSRAEAVVTARRTGLIR